MNFCVDCEHHLMGRFNHFCRFFPDQPKPDPVTGRMRYISAGRSYEGSNGEDLIAYPYRLCREINQGNCLHFTRLIVEGGT